MGEYNTPTGEYFSTLLLLRSYRLVLNRTSQRSELVHFDEVKEEEKCLNEDVVGVRNEGYRFGTACYSNVNAIEVKTAFVN